MYFSTRFAGLSQRFGGVFTGILELAQELLGASFDGINDYLLRSGDLTGNVDGKLGIIAIRIRMNGGDGVQQRIYSSLSSIVYIERASTNKLIIVAKNAGATNIFNLRNSNTITADGLYHNILISWDMAGIPYLYIDDVNVTDSILHTNDTIDYTTANHAIGSTTSGTLKTNADINFLYMNFAESLDLSIETNRRKFFTSSGGVVDLGSDGSTPTGTIPITYFEGDYSQWHINKGSGGGYTVTGALSRPAL